ncbi:MAG: S8 family serine peptidase [Oscillospiraceae bacterium]|nr:S8 family serine peptidase [Oscillospiraceae bacterium]
MKCNMKCNVKHHSKRLLSCLLALLTLLGLMGISGGAAPSQKASGINAAVFLERLDALDKGPAGSKLVVKTATNADLADDFGALAKAEGYNGLHVLKYADKASADRALARLSKLSGVVYAEYSQRVSLVDPIVTNEGSNEAEEAEPMSWGAPMVRSPEMKKALQTRDMNEVVIAILDTGLDFTHPYFVENAERITGRFADGRYAQDDYGHGTHVAGIICDNSPDNVKISPYKVLDGWGYGDDYYIATAMCAAADDGVDVVSMSLGGPSGSVMDDAVGYCVGQGVMVVVSAGNESWDASNNSPAGAPGAFTVSAVNKDGTAAYFTNYGSCVDIAAPGGYAAVDEMENAINSTTPLFCGSYYQKWAGTSMAAPFVSAAAAVVKSLYPNYTPLDIGDALKRTSFRGPGWNLRLGAGILDCLGVLSLPARPAPRAIALNRGDSLTLVLPVGFVPTGWESSDESVAAVGEDGLLTAARRGTTTVTASGAGGGVVYEVTVSYTFWQWLAYVFLFGWLWF